MPVSWGKPHEEPESPMGVRQLSIAERELLAALGTMLATWDEATEKMVAFMREQNKETAEAYSKCFPKMFDAATLARATHARYRNPQA